MAGGGIPALNMNLNMASIPVPIAGETGVDGALGGIKADGTTITVNQTTGIASAVSGGGGINQLTGDVTAGPGIGSQPATLATVNSTPGTFVSPILTVDGKGRITAIQNDIVFKRTVPVSNTGSITANIVDSIVIPANVMGKNGTIIIEAWFKGQAGNTGTCTPRITFAGSGGFDVSPVASFTSNGAAWSRTFVSNENATNVNQFSTNQSNQMIANVGSLDTTLAQTINFSLQNTVAADTFFLTQYQVTIHPSS